MDKGQVLVYVALLLVILLGMAALAVDVGYLFTVKHQLRVATDAAALAGASGLPTSPAEARSRAISIASQNNAAGSPVTLVDSDIEMGTYDFTSRTFTLLTGAQEANANCVRVTAERTSVRGNPVDLFFARVLSYLNADVSAQAIAFVVAAGEVDVPLVVDVAYLASLGITTAPLPAPVSTSFRPNNSDGVARWTTFFDPYNRNDVRTYWLHNRGGGRIPLDIRPTLSLGDIINIGTINPPADSFNRLGMGPSTMVVVQDIPTNPPDPTTAIVAGFIEFDIQGRDVTGGAANRRIIGQFTSEILTASSSLRLVE